MSGLWLGLLAAACLAAPAGAPDRPQKDERAVEDKILFERASVQWLKLYPLPVYRESWKLEGSVKSLAADLPKVREAFKKVGAAYMGAEDLGKAKKLTYRCPKESAKKALAELGKAGSFKEPVVRQSVEPVSAAEVDGKVRSLEADKAGHAAELAKMPAVSALVEELLGHLRGVKASLDKPEVTVHLLVKEKN